MNDSLQSKELKQEVINVQDDRTRDIILEDNQCSNRSTLYTELKIEELEIKEEHEKVENEDKQVQVKKKRSKKDTKVKYTIYNKHFIDKYSLKRLHIIHTEERPFEWDHTYAIFNNKSTVKRHIGTHSALQSLHTVEDSCKYEIFNIKQKDENERIENENSDNAENSIIEVKSEEYEINEGKVENQSKHKVMVQVEHSKASNFLSNAESSLHTELKIKEHEIKLEDQNEPNQVVQSAENITVDVGVTCEMCNKTFPTKSRLYKHQFTHSNVRPFQCVICDKTFKRKGELKHHLSSHTGEKPFECHVCFMKFRTRHVLINHCYTQHPQYNKYDNTYECKKTFECDVCHKGFLYESEFNRHRNIHSGEKSFKCDKCDAGFSFKSSLQKHQLTHTDLRPFQCEICNKAFKTKKYLTVHFFSHTGEKPFECHVCLMKYRTRQVLINHCYTQHPQDNKYDNVYKCKNTFECDVCHKSFLYESDFNRHGLIHSGEKPFNCDNCQKGYWKKSYLIKHLKSHSTALNKEKKKKKPVLKLFM